MRYYIAYGSNLNTYQMSRRCPQATPIGVGELKGYELLFKGSGTGAYLTIEKKRGGRVPVVIWHTTEADERNLDQYEGYPTFYYKKEMTVRFKSLLDGRWHRAKCYVYIMHEDRELGMPSYGYIDVCRVGYRWWGFDEKHLFEVVERSK